MSSKKTSKKKTKATLEPKTPGPAETPAGQDLPAEALEEVAGGLARVRNFAGDSCKETSDTGMMGCPG